MIGKERASVAVRAAIRRRSRAVSSPASPDEIQRRLRLLDETRALRAAIGPVDLSVEELLDAEDAAADG